MDWRQKIELIGKKYKELQDEAVGLVGSTDLEYIVHYAKLHPIEHWLECSKNKHIVVHPVETAGTRCLVLSSKLYPEFGILIFDAPGQRGEEIDISSLLYDHKRNIDTVCGCCSPHLFGVAEPNYDSTWDVKKAIELRASFTRAIRQTCKEQEITFLVLSTMEIPHNEDGAGSRRPTSSW